MNEYLISLLASVASDPRVLSIYRVGRNGTVSFYLGDESFADEIGEVLVRFRAADGTTSVTTLGAWR